MKDIRFVAQVSFIQTPSGPNVFGWMKQYAIYLALKWLPTACKIPTSKWQTYVASWRETFLLVYVECTTKYDML